MPVELTNDECREFLDMLGLASVDIDMTDRERRFVLNRTMQKHFTSLEKDIIEVLIGKYGDQVG